VSSMHLAVGLLRIFDHNGNSADNQSQVSYINFSVSRVSGSVFICVGCDSIVGMAIHHGLDGPGIEFWWGEIFRTFSDRTWV